MLSSAWNRRRETMKFDCLKVYMGKWNIDNFLLWYIWNFSLFNFFHLRHHEFSFCALFLPFFSSSRPKIFLGMNEWVSEWMNERKPEVLSINCLSMDHCGAALCKGFPRLPSSRRRTRNSIKLLSDRLIFTHFNLLFLHVPTAWSFNCLGRKRMDENRKSIRKVCCLSAF